MSSYSNNFNDDRAFSSDSDLVYYDAPRSQTSNQGYISVSKTFTDNYTLGSETFSVSTYELAGNVRWESKTLSPSELISPYSSSGSSTGGTSTDIFTCDNPDYEYATVAGVSAASDNLQNNGYTFLNVDTLYHFFDINNLSNSCKSFLQDNLDNDNALLILDGGDYQINNISLSTSTGSGYTSTGGTGETDEDTFYAYIGVKNGYIIGGGGTSGNTGIIDNTSNAVNDCDNIPETCSVGDLTCIYQKSSCSVYGFASDQVITLSEWGSAALKSLPIISSFFSVYDDALSTYHSHGFIFSLPLGPVGQ